MRNYAIMRVSVPFRGSRSEMRDNRYFDAVFLQFPSPFGVHVLKLNYEIAKIKGS